MEPVPELVSRSDPSSRKKQITMSMEFQSMSARMYQELHPHIASVT